jgi:hypothetical protein
MRIDQKKMCPTQVKSLPKFLNDVFQWKVWSDDDLGFLCVRPFWTKHVSDKRLPTQMLLHFVLSQYISIFLQCLLNEDDCSLPKFLSLRKGSELMVTFVSIAAGWPDVYRFILSIDSLLEKRYTLKNFIGNVYIKQIFAFYLLTSSSGLHDSAHLPSTSPYIFFFSVVIFVILMPLFCHKY